MSTTESLVRELRTRSDNPFIGCNEDVSNRVWREDFLVGRFVITPAHGEFPEIEDFDIETVYESFEAACSRLNKLDTRYSVLKRVYITQDI